MPDARAGRDDVVRIIDESGEDDLFDKAQFAFVTNAPGEPRMLISSLGSQGTHELECPLHTRAILRAFEGDALTGRALACGLVALWLAPSPEKAVLAQDRAPGPLRVVLLVDSSETVASMVTSFREGLKVFLEAVPGDPEIALVTTGGQFRMRVAPTSDRQKLLDAAAVFTADGGGNSVVRTMVEADSRFLKSADGGRGVLVVVTTDRGGYPNDNSVDIYNRFMKDFGRRGGRAHTVVIRPSGGGFISAVFENLSANTGGFGETITIASALPNVMKTLATFIAADQ